MEQGRLGKFTDVIKLHPGESITYTYDTVAQGDSYEAHFRNGWGASIIRHRGSYGWRDGLYELVVLAEQNGVWDIELHSPVANDVCGWLTEDDVISLLIEISNI